MCRTTLKKSYPGSSNSFKIERKLLSKAMASCVRAFMHVFDAADAFMTILERGVIGEIYNIGCDEGMEYSILDVAKHLIKKIHNTKDYDKWITYIEDRPFNDQRYYISNQKLKDLGWDLKISFDEGIKTIIQQV